MDEFFIATLSRLIGSCRTVAFNMLLTVTIDCIKDVGVYVFSSSVAVVVLASYDVVPKVSPSYWLFVGRPLMPRFILGQ